MIRSRSGAGHGPGEHRSYGGARVSRLSTDDIDALLSTLGRVRFVAIDFETTGLSPDQDRVVEVGAIAFHMEQADDEWIAIEEGRYETLVNPQRPIPPEVSAIHGIDDLAVSMAPTFAQVAGKLLPFLEGSILVAHNAPFDMGFLLAETVRAGIEKPANPAYDTVAIAKTAISGLPSYSLKALAASFGLEQTAAHRGGDDARVCKELFVRCVNLINTSK
ncbi:MAG TPA: 3'-5' exonuclease [bacterium]|nr:3'-5' exonuclease [bacterium]